MIQIDFNDQYLNRTVNKDVRPASVPYLGRCWHETVNSSGDPHSTLRWNLKRTQVVNGKTYVVESSYDILVARDGTPFRYVDWLTFNSWSEGASSATIDGTLYRDYQLGLRLLGIEIDGPNNGTKATAAQIETSAKIVLLTEEQLHIPPDGNHDFTHAQIAPGRKTDPRGYTIREVLEAAADLRLKLAEPDWRSLWGRADYDQVKEWGIFTRWKQEHLAGRPLGHALSAEMLLINGWVHQIFEYGLIRWQKPDKTEVWR